MSEKLFHPTKSSNPSSPRNSVGPLRKADPAYHTTFFSGLMPSYEPLNSWKETRSCIIVNYIYISMMTLPRWGMIDRWKEIKARKKRWRIFKIQSRNVRGRIRDKIRTKLNYSSLIVKRWRKLDERNRNLIYFNLNFRLNLSRYLSPNRSHLFFFFFEKEFQVRLSF